jgi:hypothetical protein
VEVGINKHEALKSLYESALDRVSVLHAELQQSQARLAKFEASAVVPEDWVTLPVKPTPQMLDEIRLTDDFSDRALASRYNALLDSAPKPPSALVPDGVWEAMQRLIENGGQLGPASRDDALLVAKHREYLLTHPQAPQQTSAVVPEWIKCSERLPTEDDADCDGNVWFVSIAWDGGRGVSREKWSYVAAHGRSVPNLIEWMPTGLKRPEAPKKEQ